MFHKRAAIALIGILALLSTACTAFFDDDGGLMLIVDGFVIIDSDQGFFLLPCEELQVDSDLEEDNYEFESEFIFKKCKKVLDEAGDEISGRLRGELACRGVLGGSPSFEAEGRARLRVNDDTIEFGGDDLECESFVALVLKKGGKVDVERVEQAVNRARKALRR